MEDFIAKSRLKYGNNFDYLKVKYINMDTEIILKCKKHGGIFEVKPINHLRSKYGSCDKCCSERTIFEKISAENIIKERDDMKKDKLAKQRNNFIIPTELNMANYGIQLLPDEKAYMINDYFNVTNNLYCVTNFGNVYNLNKKTKCGQSIKNCYNVVNLDTRGISGHTRACKINMLVYKYCSGDTNYSDSNLLWAVHHIDENKLNNNLNNLRYVPRAENTAETINYIANEMNNKKLIFINKKTLEIITVSNLHKACEMLHIKNTYENIYDFVEQNNNNEFYKISIADKKTTIYEQPLSDPNKIKLENYKSLNITDGVDLSHYYISNDGILYNNKSKSFLKQLAQPDGYLVYHIIIKQNKKTILDKHYRVHRLVAKCFLPDGEKYFYDINYSIDHVDKNSSNNHANNLRWVTKKENTQYAHNKQVLQIDQLGKVIKIFPSLKSVYESLNQLSLDLQRTYIVKNGEYYYKYKQDEEVNDVIDLKKLYKDKTRKRIIKANLEGNILNIYNSCADAKRENNLKSLNMSIEFQRKNNKNIDNKLLNKNIVPLHGFLWKYVDNETENNNILL